MDKTVCVKNLGCKVNAYECEFIMSLFLREGYKIVEDNASVFVINTCTVTNEADKKSRKVINSIRNHNKDSIIIAVGCYTQNLYNTKKSINIDANIILGNKDKSKIIEYLNEYLKNKEKIIKFYDVSYSKFEDMEINHLENHTRAFIKIQDGCDNYCSYCVIPYVRGNIKSKNKEKILNEVNCLVNNGYKEIVLTGIHTGKYNDKDYSIQIFDTAGQERFRSIITSYFRLADAFFVVFDLTNKNSLEYVPDCIETLKETIENPKFIILGNKDDLKRDKLNDNEIFKVLNTIDNFDSNYFFKVSAKEGKSIYRVFNVMIDFLKGGIIEKDIQSFGLGKTGKKKKIEKNMKCC